MSLATLMSPLLTPEDFAEWTFSNRADHDEIAAMILQKHNIMIPKFILEPVVPGNVQVFLLGHQAMHDAEAKALGIDAQNFLGEDIKDWLWDHIDQHRRERQALGI